MNLPAVHLVILLVQMLWILDGSALVLTKPNPRVWFVYLNERMHVSSEYPMGSIASQYKHIVGRVHMLEQWCGRREQNLPKQKDYVHVLTYVPCGIIQHVEYIGLQQSTTRWNIKVNVYFHVVFNISRFEMDGLGALCRGHKLR